MPVCKGALVESGNQADGLIVSNDQASLTLGCKWPVVIPMVGKPEARNFSTTQ